MSGFVRRLPVYVLLDCSESMAGDAFAAMAQGVAGLLGELRGDPMAMETAAISFLTFASTARQVVPLTNLYTYPPHQLPQLRMGAGTALGAALELWERCMAREVVQTSAERKGDFKPVCFVLTDGEPTDRWEAAADRVRTALCGKRANVIAVGCGPDADLDKLRRVTPTVVAMKGTDAASFGKFFKWVSASVSSASQSLGGAGDKGVSLPGLPDDCLEVARPGQAREGPVPDRFVFLHARCVKSGAFYVARFAKQEGRKGLLGSGKPVYRGVAGHLVEDFDFGPAGEGAGLNVSTECLDAPPACPACRNPLLGSCASGHLHCCPPLEGTVQLTCPWCKVAGTYGNAGFFDVGRGAG
ncbi:MAG TPA: TerY-C metal binding domain-containing protein [Gemmataceae bacterium]|nr:TerY-C metal binding domain-containing protein [Gemmataceae bacterium]